MPKVNYHFNLKFNFRTSLGKVLNLWVGNKHMQCRAYRTHHKYTDRLVWTNTFHLEQTDLKAFYGITLFVTLRRYIEDLT